MVKSACVQEQATEATPGRFLRVFRLTGLGLGPAIASWFLARGILLGTSPGILLSGWFAAIFVVVTLEAWLRPNSRISGYLLFGTGLLLAAALGPIWFPTARQRLLALALVGLFVFLFLYGLKRRRKRPPKRWPEVRARTALPLIVLGLAAGVGWGIFLYMDEPLQDFPRLVRQAIPVPDDQNGFVVLRDLVGREAIPDDEDFRPLRDKRGQWPDPLPPEWPDKARVLLAKWADCLSSVDQVLARPHFQAPMPETYEDAWESDEAWLDGLHDLGALMAVRCGVLLAEGRSEEALAAADKIVQLGVAACRGNNGTMTYLIGAASLRVGLDLLRTAAGSDGVRAELLAQRIASVGEAAELKEAYVHALAGEFHRYRLILVAWESLEVFEPEDEEQRRKLAAGRALTRRFRWVKVNMSLNTVGRRLEAVIDRLDHWDPASWEWAACTPEERIWDHGLVQLVRNPMGSFMAALGRPWALPLGAAYFMPIAEARMTQIFLALRCYHLEHGRLPDTLDQLVPRYFEALAADPYTEGPFGYEPAAEPPCVYSVGPDQESDEPDAEHGDDLIVELRFASAPLAEDASKEVTP